MRPAPFLLAPLLIASATLAQTPPPRETVEDVARPQQPENAGQALGRAATRPLRDLNLVKPKVSPDLESVMADPYDVSGLRNCRRFNAEVNRMTALVGPDVDDPLLAGNKDNTAVELLGGGAESVTGSLIPGQGLLRAITGANKSARHAAAARLAGQLRRSYLKGLMKARGCRLVPDPPAQPAAPPAAPSR